MLHDGAHIADLLRGVIVVRHAVDDGDRAAFPQFLDRLVRDDARHHDVHKL